MIESLRYDFDDPDEGITKGDKLYTTNEEREELVSVFSQSEQLLEDIANVMFDLKKKSLKASGQRVQSGSQ